MRVLVTGSAGHLGEALVRSLRKKGESPLGVDIKPSAFTDRVGSIVDTGFVDDCMDQVDAVLHAATLHKPHVATHSRQDFVDTNITGTLNLLESAVRTGVGSFIFTSTTSTFGNALRPGPGEPAVWVTEELQAAPKNIYGVTKTAAESLCRLFHRNFSLPCIVLRTSRFFPEDDDNRHKRAAFDDDNLKVNELLFRRADIADMVSAHIHALEKAPATGFETLIVSATPPFERHEAGALGEDAPTVIEHHFPGYQALYEQLGWTMFKTIGRVYDNSRARSVLGWEPEFSFERAISALSRNEDYRSPLAVEVGAKGYHDTEFEEGPYPVEETPFIETGHDR
jgi:UDP-glucose 4-epimerase